MICANIFCLACCFLCCPVILDSSEQILSPPHPVSLLNTPPPQFYDGFVKSVRSINVRRMLAADSDFVKDCKEQQLMVSQT